MTRILKTLLITIYFISFSGSIKAQDINNKNELIYSYLFKTETDPYVGYKDSDTTFVVFFDYLCGYCRLFENTISEYVNENNDAKFIKKHYPILSQNSIYAAKAAISANKQGFFFEFDKELLELKPNEINVHTINNIAKKLNLDMIKFEKDMNSIEVSNEISVNKKIGQDLNIKGTPTIISNNKNIYFGNKDIKTLKRIVNENK